MDDIRPVGKELLAGFVVNKFRGDPDLLAPAHSYMRNRTGKPVLGVIPMMRDISIPEEDRAALPCEQDEQARHEDCLDVAVVMPAHVSNFTDFAPLAAEPDVRLRQVRTREEWGNPDLVILPGTKSVAADLAGLRAAGLEEPIRRHAEKGKWLRASAEGCKCWGRTFWTRCTWNPRGAHARTGAAGTFHHLLFSQNPDQCAPGKHAAARSRRRLKPPWRHQPSRIQPPVMFREDGSCGYGKGRIWATYLHGMLTETNSPRIHQHGQERFRLKANPALHTAYDLDGGIAWRTWSGNIWT
ncbi:MAG: hypothetical protein ACLT38_01940 [Akkermansia sp.]